MNPIKFRGEPRRYDPPAISRLLLRLRRGNRFFPLLQIIIDFDRWVLLISLSQRRRSPIKGYFVADRVGVKGFERAEKRRRHGYWTRKPEDFEENWRGIFLAKKELKEKTWGQSVEEERLFIVGRGKLKGKFWNLI